MSTFVGQQTETMLPAEFARGEGDCQYLRVATITGMGADWIVWINYEKPDHKAYVVHAPTSGPPNFVGNWGNRPQEVHVFSADNSEHKNAWRVMDAAVMFAAKSASDEVLAEYN